MDPISHSDLHALLASHAAPCVSIYVPTHASGREGEQDPLRFTQLVDQAEERLANHWMRSVEARDLLAPLRQLALDTTFWHDRSDGLAVFFGRDLYQRYRLPVTFEPLFSVGTRFITRPLLTLLTEEDRFLLLALSQHAVRLYEGNRYRLTPRAVPGLPTNLETALNLVAADQGRKQMHMAGADPTRRHATIYHGHGGKPDALKDEIHSFFRSIDGALHPSFRSEDVPLLIAGVDYLLPIYREINTYPHLAVQQLEANCDYLSEYELHERAWPIVQNVMSDKRKGDIERVYRSADRAHCVADIHTILPAADQGRVELLLIDQQARLYGTFNPTKGEVTVRPNGEAQDEDLIDLAAANTLTHGGMVYTLSRKEIPDKSSIAAVLRY